MKYTKIITSLFVAAAFLLSSSAMAAEKGKGKGKGRSNPIMSLSGLTGEQKKELQALNKEFAGKMKEVGQDRDKRRALFQERQKKLMAILTDDQKEELKKKMAEARKNRGGEKGKSKGKGKGGDKKKKKKDS